MTPSTARKRGLIHRYYVSRALLEGRKGECGSHPRVAADQIETLVTDALKARSAGNDADGDARAILQSVQRIIAQKGNLRVEMADAADGEDRVLEIPWTPRGSGRPKREVLEPAVGVAGDQRPMRSEVRATLVRAIALGRLWLQELTSGKVKDTGEIAVRED